MTPLLSLLAASALAAGTLKVCDDVADPATLDPHRQFSEKNHTVVQQIYEGLVRFDPEGRIEPALATSWERVDPLRMRFKLRKGVRFHDGRPFDAEAVRDSIRRYLDPATGFPALGFISSIKEAVPAGPLEVDVVTHHPDGLLLNRLAGFILIVPPGAEGQGALQDRPVGTGAFRFVRWEKGKRIVLERNPDYWMKGRPELDGLEFVFLPWEKQVDALMDGAVDLLTGVPGTETLRLHRSERTKVLKKPTFYTVGSSMRIGDGPLKDVRVRRALNLALDKDDLIRYDILGNGRPLASLTFPGQLGFDEGLAPFPFDRERAKRLLAEAGYPEGFELETFLKVNAERTGRIIAKQLEDVGVRLKLSVFSDSELVEGMASRKWDLTIGDVPDPMNHPFFIQAIFTYSKSPYSLAKDERYDRLLEEMMLAVDGKEQARLALALNRYVHEQALSLFTYQRVRTYGLRREVRFEPYVSGMPYFFQAAIEKGGRDEAKKAR